MGNESIEQLYKHPEVFDIDTDWIVSEKVHGTSTWIDFKGHKLIFHSGGTTSKEFQALFNHEELKANFELLQLQYPNVSHFRIRAHRRS